MKEGAAPDHLNRLRTVAAGWRVALVTAVVAGAGAAWRSKQAESSGKVSFPATCRRLWIGCLLPGCLLGFNL
jgi:hypothetical protein